MKNLKKILKKIGGAITALIFFSTLATTTLATATKEDVQNYRPTAREIGGAKRAPKTFIAKLSPVIEDVRKEVELNRKKVQELAKKKDHTAEEKEFLGRISQEYGFTSKDYEALAKKMVVPPTSLILAQATHESDSGTSRIAREANNLFGMRSFKAGTPRISALNSTKVFYRKYPNVRESIMDYVVNFGKHSVYAKLRDSIRRGESSVAMTQHLKAYAADPKYAVTLANLIKGLKLQNYDKV